jgi:hypothetical protein
MPALVREATGMGETLWNPGRSDIGVHSAIDASNPLEHRPGSGEDVGGRIDVPGEIERGIEVLRRQPVEVLCVRLRETVENERRESLFDDARLGDHVLQHLHVHTCPHRQLDGVLDGAIMAYPVALRASFSAIPDPSGPAWTTSFA